MRLEEGADRERDMAMAEAEFWKQFEKDDGGEGLGDQIHGVRLEVEKVRSEMAKMDTGLSDRIGGVRLEVEKVRTEMTDQIGGLERRMSEQIRGVEKGLRAWMAVGVSLIAVLVALMSVLG